MIDSLSFLVVGAAAAIAAFDPLKKGGALQPLALAESGWVRVGTGSGVTGLSTARITLMRGAGAALSRC
jgi:hypothetical protein